MKDKTVIITGATKGMGFASSKRLLELGANVVMVYREDADTAKNVAKELQTYSKHILLLEADITNDNDRKVIVNNTLAKFTRIDVLVNNAGTSLAAIS